MYPAFWKAKEIRFLREEYWFQSWRGRYNCELGHNVSVPRTQRATDRWLDRLMCACLTPAEAAGRRGGVTLPMKPHFTLTHLDKMKPTMQGEY